ncbi:unnamed protein product [Clonostachys rosea]|uniref:Sulfatase-modifying factor enzyme domain-containing protein n=1 Tax=Bionectria ochroleuca TaxID=29856 RepID=A0ABY6U8K9_BIOOC|nr:unnamed protein product [Clonostachys rosea]
MAVPGIILRLTQPKDNSATLPPNDVLAPPAIVPGVEGFYIFESQDDLTPRYQTTYFISDIRPILESSSYFDEDVKRAGDQLASLGWEVASFVNGRDSAQQKEMTSEPHLLPSPPAIGSTLISNGGTPADGWDQDYNDWYNKEHSAALSLVPGWNNCRRYKHEKAYGGADYASWYGWNYYDAENGLYGPEWQASMTPWTKKVRGQGRKPNLRRIWKVIRN